MRDVSIQYASRRERRARRRLECTGGSTWCHQTIQPGETYTALVRGADLVGKWCTECTRALARW